MENSLNERRSDLRVVLLGLGILSVLAGYLGSTSFMMALIVIVAVIVGMLLVDIPEKQKKIPYYCSAHEL